MVFTDFHIKSDGTFAGRQEYIDTICDKIEKQRDAGTLPKDDSRDVDALLEKNKERIVHIRSEAIKFASAEEKFKYLDHDEWILRYALSFPKNSNAVGSIKRCLLWRREPLHAEIENCITNGLGLPGDFNEKTLSQYMTARMVGLSKYGGFVMYGRNGLGSPSRLIEDHGEEPLTPFLANRELIGQVQFEVMKRARRIIKLSIVMDMKDTSFAEAADRRFSNMFQKISKVSGDVWPQLLHKMVLVNPPSFFYHMWTVVKRIFPKKTVEKMELIKDNQHFVQSEFVQNSIEPELIPSYLGGPLCDLPPHLTGQLLKKDIRTRTARVPARGQKKIYVQSIFETASIIDYEFSVPTYSVEFSAYVEQGVFDLETIDSDGFFKFTPKGEKREILEKMKLKDNSDTTLNGTWEVEGPCQITVVMNNDWSVLRSKEAKYNIEVRDKDVEDESLPARMGGMSL